MKKTETIKSWTKTILFAQFLAFFFLALVFINGGDALNGKFESGKYYFGMNGKYQEVSWLEYKYGIFHSTITFVGQVLAITFACIFLRKKSDWETPFWKNFSNDQVKFICGYPLFWLGSFGFIRMIS